MPPMEILKEVANLMTYYYPERLYKSYMLFTPWVFSAIFKMIIPILPTKTQDKIINPGWYESENHDTFKYDIDKGQLIKRYGGDNTNEYSFEWEVTEWNKLYPKQLQGNKRDEVVLMEEKDPENDIPVNEDQKVNDEENKNNIIEEEEEDNVKNEDKQNGKNKGQEEEEEEEDDDKLCIVCMDGARDHVMIPCGHIAVCGECKDEYKGDDAVCPLCRAKVDMVVKTFN